MSRFFRKVFHVPGVCAVNSVNFNGSHNAACDTTDLMSASKRSSDASLQASTTDEAPEITYFFYDLETTGLRRSSDQAVRFAGIRTTSDFKELEHHEISVKLNPDVIPAPGALLVNALSIDVLRCGNNNEYEAMKQIYMLVNNPGTVSVGYNSLGFDDLLLQFGFYRNLLHPTAHHSLNGYSRMDIYPMTVASSLLSQLDHLKWIMKNGVPSFNLASMNLESPKFSDVKLQLIDFQGNFAF